MTNKQTGKTGTQVSKPKHTRRNVILIIIAVVVVVAIAIVALLPRGPHKTIADEVTRTIDNSQIGQTVDRIVPANRLISTMLTPANKTWWAKLAPYIVRFKLDTIPYEQLRNPSSLGLVTLYNTGENYNSSLYLATPAVMLTYKTKQDAAAARNNIIKLQQDSTLYGVYQLDNNLIMLPGSSIAEDLFTIKKYVHTTQTQPIDRAYWHISWNNLNDYMHSVQSASYRKTYDQVLAYTGAQATKAESYWDGYSTDGMHWYGENNTSDNKPAFDPAKADITKALATISKTSKDQVFVQKDGTVASYGVTIPYQSAVLNYLAVSTPSLAAGQFIDAAQGKVTKPIKSKDPNAITITMDPNRWFQYMARNVNTVWYFFDYQRLVINLHTNSNDMDLTFSQPSQAR